MWVWVYAVGNRMQRTGLGVASVFQWTENTGGQKKIRSDTDGIPEGDGVSHQQDLGVLDGDSRAAFPDVV